MEPLTLALIVFEYVVMVLSISMHDLAQAWMANRRGDPTARMMGRISLNPMRHFDIWGMVILPLVDLFIFNSPLPFGWGAPVPMTFRNFRKKSDETIAVAAGPIAQVLAAVVSLVLLLILKHTVPGAAISLEDVVSLSLQHQAVSDLAALPAVFPILLLLYMSIMMNLLLAILNLLPIPFLDGGKILVNYLPYNAARTFERSQMLFMIAFFFLAWPLAMIAFKPLLIVFTALLERL